MKLDIELPVEESDIEVRRGLKRYVQSFADALFGGALRTLLTACLVCAGITVIIWNLNRLQIFDDLAALEYEEYALQAQLSSYEKNLSEINVNQLLVEIDAENERIFQGFPQLAAWAEGLSRIAARDGLTFRYTAEDAHPSPVPDVLEVPINLQFLPGEATADQLFELSTVIIGDILKDHWHIDVLSTRAEGDGQRMTRLTLKAQVWVRDRFGFVEVAGNSHPARRTTGVDLE